MPQPPAQSLAPPPSVFVTAALDSPTAPAGCPFPSGVAALFHNESFSGSVYPLPVSETCGDPVVLVINAAVQKADPQVW